MNNYLRLFQGGVLTRGVTLLELLFSVVLITAALVAISLVFPKASATISTNRRHMLATQLANTKIQEIAKMPYAYVPLTPTAQFNVSTTNPGGCDCGASAEDFSKIPADTKYTESSVTYTRKVCINLVDRDPAVGTWSSFCTDNTSGTDKGMKKIRVRVDWTTPGKPPSFTLIESLVTRP